MTREERAEAALDGERRLRNDYRHSSRITAKTAIRAMLAFADAEAAAMRERAAGVADERVEAYGQIRKPILLNAARQGEAERIAAAIRALPATGEV